MADANRERIARACGVDRTTASRWATGTINPPLRHVPQILAALNLNATITLGYAASSTDISRFRNAEMELRRHNPKPRKGKEPDDGSPETQRSAEAAEPGGEKAQENRVEEASQDESREEAQVESEPSSVR